MAIKAMPGYNPYAYVPGGAKPKVAKAIQTLGMSKAKLPYNPLAYVPGGSSPAVASAIQAQGFATPQVKFPTIPQASSVVAPQSFAQAVAAPVSVPVDAVSGGVGGLGNYMDELTSDRLYQLAQKNYEDALAMGERSLFATPFKQALIQYGVAPGEAELAGLTPEAAALARKYLDPAAIAAAQGNPYSTAKQIDYGFNRASAGLAGDYTQRGTLGGGGMNVAQSNLNYQRGLQAKQTMDELLGAVGNANQNWLNFQGNEAEKRRAAQAEVANRLAQIAGYNALLDAFGNQQAGSEEYESGGFLGDSPLPSNIEDYPYLNPEAPDQVYTPVIVGSGASFEPKPTAGNYIAAKPKAKPATAKAIARNVSKKLRGGF